MTEQEKQAAALIEKIKSEVNGSESIVKIQADLTNLTEGAMTVDSFKEKMDAFAEEHGISGLKEDIGKVALDLKKMQEAGPKAVKSLRDTLIENHDKIKAVANGTEKVFNMENVKTTVLTSAVSGNTMALRKPGVNETAYRSIVIADLFTPMTIGDDYNGDIKYYDDANLVRNAATIAEGGTYPESAIDWVEQTLSVRKIGDTIPVSEEALVDVDFIESRLRKFLEVNVALKEDIQLWSGDNIAPNLKGVYTSATTFNAATMAQKKVDASIYDLIRSMGVKISNGKESKYMANFAVMNPEDVDIMESKKDGVFNYIVPPFVSSDGTRVKGIQIVESSVVTQGTMIVGDFRHGEYWRRQAYDLTFGWVSDQFKKDLMTMKARKRAALLIPLLDATAFYKVTDITAALAAMTA